MGQDGAFALSRPLFLPRVTWVALVVWLLVLVGLVGFLVSLFRR
jgi:hypothetical protein